MVFPEQNLIQPNALYNQRLEKCYGISLYCGGGTGGKRLPPPVPPLLPPVPFCELSPASRLFSTKGLFI